MTEQGEGFPGWMAVVTDEQRKDIMPGVNLVGAWMKKILLDDIAFCLKTFERPKAAQRCVDSILAMYPTAKIYQADDSRKPVPAKGVHKFWPLPHDVGVSAGRNHLIRHTTEAFIVQVDDDYIFDKHTDILRMKQLLEEHDDLVLAGCKCRHIRANKTGWTKYYGKVRIDTNGVLWSPQVDTWHEEPDGLKWADADTISNFWIAKRRLFDSMMWDERLKIGGEHADFFQRLQAANGDEAMFLRIIKQKELNYRNAPLMPVTDAGRMKVAFIPSFYVSHKKDRPGIYQKFRKRDKTYEQIYRKMWGINQVNRWRYGKA